ncbi:penicillin-binding transpeptidase domain-containing protein [Thalassotalea ponticola]|uniref:peptidoglycan D,D-transpeptidase FtsI family protein n=1 Tax=Thalassotalea ponticola TaxID=1523392 RepID=UPI0025B2C3A8|nr:penicillin-binding transpeptidase domain-containing protein [Thalassotalea ponticola]MDN3653558.1 penicillin-binding transpeptidase domain-containing protein [Thalassotalea ponticola]
MTVSKVKRNKDRAMPTTIAWRFNVVVGLICLVFAGIAARAAYIQVIEPDLLQVRGDNRTIRNASNYSYRGAIVDRNGIELAISVPVQTVYADPQRFIRGHAGQMKKRVHALAQALDMNVTEITERIGTDDSRRFVYLARHISPRMAEYIKQLKIPGIGTRQETKRFYPTAEISAHVVGFTNVDDEGIEGIERLFNERLTGIDGKDKYIKDARGNRIEVLEKVEPVPPEDVVLSIDQRIQTLAYKELKAAIKSFQAASGSAVVLDVHSGEILAMVNGPSYNPNNRSNVAVHRFRNRAITDTFEPGSTMKPLTILSALELGSKRKDDIIDTSPGWMRIGGRRVSDPRNYGELSLTEVLIKSSNMGSTRIAMEIPKEFLLSKFFEMGFAEDTGSGLIGESSGQLSDRPRWSQFELAALSYGYGLAITPLQLARFYATIGNGGKKVPLSILKDPQFNQGEQVLDAYNTRAVLEMMEQVVLEGAPKAKVAGYRVAGKTGTVRKATAGGYGNEYMGIFAGVAPVSDPRLAVVVVINEPGGDDYHGGEVAAPVFSRIMGGALQHLNIAPDDATLITQATRGLGD